MRVWGKRCMKKIDKICFFILNLGVFIIFFPWLIQHYATDSYYIMDVGYEYYAINNSLNDGRIFMFIILKIANILKISYTNFIRFTLIFALIISNISVLILKKIIVEYVNIFCKKIEIFIWLISYVIIYNYIYIENLYYVECIVMAMAVLFNIIAANIVVKHNNRYIFKVVLLVFGSAFCYQTMPIIFLVYVMLFECLEKNDIKVILKKFLQCFIIVILTLIINYSCINLIHNIFYIELENIRAESLLINELNFTKLLFNIVNLLVRTPDILLHSNGALYEYVFVAFLVLLVFVYIYIKEDIFQFKLEDFKFFVILICGIYFVSNSISIITLYAFDSARIRGGVGIIIGALMIYILNKFYSEKLQIKYKKIEKMFEIIIIVFFVINVINYVDIINSSRLVNKKEKEFCINVKNDILVYENEYNIKINTIIYVLDKNVNVYFSNIRRCGATVNACVSDWSAKSVIEFYSKREFSNLKRKDLTEINNLNLKNGYDINAGILYVLVKRY